MSHVVHRTLVIASPYSETCGRWSNTLQEAFAVCLVSEADALEQITANLKPSILVLDLALPGFGKIKGLATIQHSSPVTKTLVLTDAPTNTEGIAALKAGAKGYYTRSIEPVLLKKAV